MRPRETNGLQTPLFAIVYYLARHFLSDNPISKAQLHDMTMMAEAVRCGLVGLGHVLDVV
jgi:hypothetical protein